MFQKKQPKKNQKKSTEDNFLIVPSLSKIEDNINNKSAAKNYLHIFFQKEFFSLLKRRWKIVTGITCGITAIVAWWIFQQSPIYQGKFVLLLEKQQGLQNTDNNNNQIINNNLNNSSINSQVDYSTEIQILGSARVIAPILKEISQEYPEIYNDINLTDLKNLEINQIDKSKIIEVAFQNKNPEKVKFVLEKIAQEYLDKNSDLLQGNRNKGLKFIQSQTSQLQKKVDFLQDKLQRLREKYKVIDPQITAKELTQQFLATEKEYFQLQTQLEEAKNIYKDLQEQLNLTPEEAIAVTSLTESVRYQSLLQQLQSLDIELAKESAIYTDLSPVIIELKEKRENIIQLLQEEAEKFAVKPTLNNPNNSSDIILSTPTPSTIRSQLTEELLNKDREIKRLTTKVKNVEQILGKLNKKIAEMPSVTREYSDLQRELDISTSSLTRLLKTQETLEIQKAQNSFNWEIISPPQLNGNPSRPFPPYNLVFVALGGFILGTIVAIIVDKLDNSIQTVNELKEISSQPILGYIPFNKKVNQENNWISRYLFSEKQNKNSPSFELIDNLKEKSSLTWIKSFQNLYTNIHFLKPNNILKSVVISSPNSGVGKSTISLHLAQTAATMGKRVLLVDSNLRSPQIHEMLGIDNSSGLSDVLTGKMDLSSVIKEVPQQDKFSVITSGKLLKDVNRLLLSSSMEKIINNLSTLQQFDLIIFDTPSILNFVEAKIIAAHTDGLILTVQLGKTENNAVKQVTEQLKVAKIPLLGIIINGIKYHENYYSQSNHNHDYKSQKNQTKKLVSDFQ